MKIQDWFENWGITGLKINAGFLELEWKPLPDEAQAAWELYIELITRIAVRPLPDQAGDEAAALASIHALFAVVRDLLKSKGRKALVFSQIAVIILNQKIRPFTEAWHPILLADNISKSEDKKRFRAELKALQKTLQQYAAMLARVADIEDFQDLEQGALKRI